MSYGASALKDAIINLKFDDALKICEEMLKQGVIRVEEFFDIISQALNVVGERYEKGEYFVSDLIVAGDLVKEILKLIELHYGKIERKPKEPVARVVLASVRGDIHDIGKSIVSMLLQAAGFEVIDLGVDVPPEEIVKAVKKYNAKIVGLSALLTTTVPEIKNVILELEKAGIRKDVKVVVGGAAVTEAIAKEYGADAYGRTAVDGLKICQKWAEELSK
jgi:5-methyltetrahydrofolate--homocysteine methyltransferase